MKNMAHPSFLDHPGKHEDIYLDDHDRDRHRRSMAAVADEVDRPFEEVSAIYEDVLRQLAAEASILDYLPVLVSKRVRRMYKTPGA